jgi:hypothetical protein
VKHSTTIELTRGELGDLWFAMKSKANKMEAAYLQAEREGWYDAKSKERVVVAHDEANRLAFKLEQVIKEMDA